MYEYKTHQLAPTFVVSSLEKDGNAAAVTFSDILNEYAKDGWEYVRADTFSLKEKPGCFGGQAKETGGFHVLVFRRLRS